MATAYLRMVAVAVVEAVLGEATVSAAVQVLLSSCSISATAR